MFFNFKYGIKLGRGQIHEMMVDCIRLRKYSPKWRRLWAVQVIYHETLAILLPDIVTPFGDT